MFVVPNYGAAVLEVVGLGLMIAGLVLGLIVAVLFIVNAFRGSPRSKRLEVAFAIVAVLLGGGGWLSHNFLPLSVGVVLTVAVLAGAEYFTKRDRQRIAL